MSNKAIEVRSKVRYIKGSVGWRRYKDTLFTVVEDNGNNGFIIEEDDGYAVMYAHGGIDIEPVEVEGEQDGT